MNTEIKQQILDDIKSYNTIIISRHSRPDGDAVGSTMGLAYILRESFPEKEILVSNEDYTEYINFLGDEDGVLSDSKYMGALQIVVDTGTTDRISNKKYHLADKLIKIDHHIDNNPYGDVSWVEDQRSSACEMIVDFYNTFKDCLKMNKEAALALYTGMVTDSGRFRYDGTSGETFRMAAILLDYGVDIETLYARLYLDDFDYLKFQSYVYDNMNITENGVAYIYVDEKMQKDFNLSREDASNVISMLGEIKGSIIWLAFIDNLDEEKTIRVRLRSRFTTVNGIAEKFSGGGHACASGATVHNKEEMEALIAMADAQVKEFKANNFYL